MHEGRMVAPIEILNGVAKALPTGFKSTLQSVRMIVMPLILSAPAVMLWHFCYEVGFHSNPIADGPITNAIVPLLGSIHIFLVSFLLIVRKGNDLREMKQAVKTGDKEKFLSIAEDCTPAPLKYILFVTGNMVILWVISLYYENYWSGFFSVLCMSYVIILIWEVIADFDDPVNGIWVVNNVPSEWLEGAKIKRRLADRIFENIFGEEAKK